MRILILIAAALLVIAPKGFADDEGLILRVDEARGYVKTGQFDKAIATLENKLPHEPGRTEAPQYLYACGAGYNNLGYSYLRLGDAAKAVKHLTKASEILPDKSAPYYLLGQAYFMLNDFKKSVESFGKAMSMEPGAALMIDYSCLIGSFIRLNDKENAEKTLKTARARFPGQIGNTTVADIEKRLRNKK